MEKSLTIYGNALKTARMAVKPKLSQEAVAKALGMERSTYTQWEAKGAIDITENQLKILINLLGVTANVLTNDKQESPESYILDHPFVKQMVDQSIYIMERVRKLEAENDQLRGGGS